VPGPPEESDRATVPTVLSGSSGRAYNGRDGFGVRHVDGVTARCFGDGGSPALGHGALGGRRDHAVVGRDEVPTGSHPPGGLGHDAAESVHAPGHLGVGHEGGLLGGQVGGERPVEPLAVQEQEAIASALLPRATVSTPLVMIVDDLPWLDRSSALVLGVVARRLTGTRVGFLGAFRTSESGFFDGNGLPWLDVLALADAAAGALVDDRFPALADAVRHRLLAEARGNPLALLELPIALSLNQRAGAEPLPTLSSR